MFPDDQVTAGNVQEVAMEGDSDQMSSEDHDSMEIMTYQVSKYNLLYKTFFLFITDDCVESKKTTKRR